MTRPITRKKENSHIRSGTTDKRDAETHPNGSGTVRLSLGGADDGGSTRRKGGSPHPTLLSILLALSVNLSCNWHKNSRFVGLPRSGSTDCPKKRAIAS